MKLKYALLLSAISLALTACGGSSNDSPKPPTVVVDTTPDSFSFSAIENAPLNKWVESAPVTITGINTDTPISIENGEYSIDGGEYIDSSGSIENGQTVSIRIKGEDFSQTVLAQITIGDVSGTFQIKTQSMDTVPDDFSFTANENAPLNEWIESESITISGINTATPISIENGEYSINGGEFTSEQSSIENQQTIKVRFKTSNSKNMTGSLTLTVGGYGSSWDVTTVKNIYSLQQKYITNNHLISIKNNLVTSGAEIWGLNLESKRDQLLFDLQGNPKYQDSSYSYSISNILATSTDLFFDVQVKDSSLLLYKYRWVTNGVLENTEYQFESFNYANEIYPEDFALSDRYVSFYRVATAFPYELSASTREQEIKGNNPYSFYSYRVIKTVDNQIFFTGSDESWDLNPVTTLYQTVGSWADTIKIIDLEADMSIGHLSVSKSIYFTEKRYGFDGEKLYRYSENDNSKELIGEFNKVLALKEGDNETLYAITLDSESSRSFLWIGEKGQPLENNVLLQHEVIQDGVITLNDNFIFSMNNKIFAASPSSNGISEIHNSGLDVDSGGFVEHQGLLYFISTSEEHGQELWRTDGTKEGTRLVKDIKSGASGSNISNLTSEYGYLTFFADDGINGKEVWMLNNQTLEVELLTDN
ncbi:MAG: ELWxxDGT repeat protein [Pseudomonadota bacterium]|nr:ELWxxDGT repeat protein [Pseudomonadota bacterium]